MKYTLALNPLAPEPKMEQMEICRRLRSLAIVGKHFTGSLGTVFTYLGGADRAIEVDTDNALYYPAKDPVNGV